MGCAGWIDVWLVVLEQGGSSWYGLKGGKRMKDSREESVRKGMRNSEKISGGA